MPPTPSRRTFLHVVAAGGIGSIAGCTSVRSGGFEAPPLPAQPATEARQFKYDAQNTSVTGTRPPTDGIQRWKVRRDELGSNEEAIDGLAALDDYLILVTKAALHSLDPDDGTERWRTDPGYDGQTPAASPALSAETAYVAWQQGDEGGLSAIDLTDGSERWRSDPVGQVESNLTLVDNTIYVSVGFPRKRAVIAVDTADESVRWRWRFPTPVRIPVTPAVADGTVYVGGGNEDEGIVYALDAESGEKRWEFSTPDWWWLPPTVVDGTVYIPSTIDDQVYALNAADGREEWSASLSGSVAATSESLYVAAKDKITILDTDGTERWTQTLTDSHLPVVASDTLIVGDDSGAVCLDLTDGKSHWEQTVESGIHGHEKAQGISCVPVVTDDSVFLGTPAGDIYAIGE